MGTIITFLLAILVEPVADVLLEFLLAIGVVAVSSPFRREERTHPALAGLGIALISAVIALVYHLLFPQTVLPPSPLPGISILLSPLALGSLMHLVGEWLKSRGRPASHLTTFWGGALFAFVFSATRFLLLANQWP